MYSRSGSWLAAVVLCGLAPCISGAVAGARPHRRPAHKPAPHAKHVAAPRLGPPRDHQRFEGGGTGGDSPKPESSAPELLLTFDDGPALDKTPKVLDLLDKHGYKAVFFVCGVHLQGKSAAAEKSRELLREVIRRGHMVGNHTVHHLFLCNKTNESKIVEEVEGNGKLIADALGQPPYLFRTPYGAHCPTLAKTLHDLGIRPIGWDIDPQDWRLKDAAKIEAVVKASFRNMHGRQILLMHDVQGATIAALPKILDDLDAENERRTKAGEPPIKVISYDYLLENRTTPTPLLDVVTRVAVQAAVDTVSALAHTIGTPVPALGPPDAGAATP